MSALATLLNPKSYLRWAERQLARLVSVFVPNYRGIHCHPPGHFYSPLLDLQNLPPNANEVEHDGVECWEFIDLRGDAQQTYYQDLIDRFPMLDFPRSKMDGYRYYWDNKYYVFSDAFTLSGVIRKEKPKRIIEIGSGFSSAVMLDTLAHTGTTAELTFIEPFPDRLQSLLTPAELISARLLTQPVQAVPLALFEELEAQDILFIDSSHVAKIGSDVTCILLRILPRLRPGVLVHFHDIFYPFSYPISWVSAGRAWNESLFLRAFLINNPTFEIVAFNSFAGSTFPEVFRGRVDQFLNDTGGSIWIRKRI